MPTFTGVLRTTPKRNQVADGSCIHVQYSMTNMPEDAKVVIGKVTVENSSNNDMVGSVLRGVWAFLRRLVPGGDAAISPE